MLSITQFPRRFITANKRTLLSSNTFRYLLAPSQTAFFHHASKLDASFKTMSRTSAWMIPIRSIQTTTTTNNPPTTSATVTLATTPGGTSKTPSAIHATSCKTFATAAASMEEEHDAYLYGDRDDSWYTTSRHPKYDPNFPGICSTTRHLSSIAMPNLKSCTREEMLDYFDNTWALTDALFANLQGEKAFLTPPPHQLRHPLIFYYGHPTVFFVNKLVVSGLFKEPVNPYFEQIFEVGVDEMRWDDMSKNEMEWPDVHEVTEYRRQVYGRVRDLILTHEGLNAGHAPIDESNQLWALCMALEHERIHLETSSVLMQEHPVHFFQRNPLLPSYHESAEKSNPPSKKPVLGVDYPKNEMIFMKGSQVSIGKPRDFPSFGWDNEYGSHQIQVRDFKASKQLISNGEFWEFVSNGGYLEPSYWSMQGWEWRCFRNTKWPSFWIPDGPSGSHQYKLRAIFDILPMQWDWPAQVNFHEAQAFCRWKNEKDGNKDKEFYHLTTEPMHQLMRDDHEKSANTQSDDILEIKDRMSHEKAKNLNFSYMSMSPVNAMKPNEKGFHDVFGNAWEWCEDKFNPLPGFKIHKYYDDFSAPCFDGEHQVIMGGSFISSGDNGASKFARYHFRPHFFQHAGFRIISQPIDLETNTIHLSTTCINAPGPYAKPEPYRTSDIFNVLGNGNRIDSINRLFFEEIHRKSENLLEDFVQQIKASLDMLNSPENVLLVRNGFQGASKLKNQVNAGGIMVIVDEESTNAPALNVLLSEEFSFVQTAALPVFKKENEGECRVRIASISAWKKLK
jgi:5-histidylcysteine sulfoxide synthase